MENPKKLDFWGILTFNMGASVSCRVIWVGKVDAAGGGGALRIVVLYAASPT